MQYMIYPQNTQYDYGLGIDPQIVEYVKESVVVASRILSQRCYLFQRNITGSVVGNSTAPVTVTSYFETSPRYKTIIWASGVDHPDTRAYVQQGAGALRVLINGSEAARVLTTEDIIADNEFAVIERWDLTPARIEVAFNAGFNASGSVIQYYYTSLNEGVVKEMLKRGDAGDQSLFGWTQYRNSYFDDYQGKNQVLVRMPLTSRDLVVKEEGKITLEENDSWMIYEPYVRDFDLLVVPAAYTLSGENEWYEITDKRDSVYQRVLTHQRFKLKLLEAGDPRTRLSIITT